MIGQPERTTQDRVIALFRDQLGYRYLGDWQERANNSNIEAGLLSDYLVGNGYTKVQITGAIHQLHQAMSWLWQDSTPLKRPVSSSRSNSTWICGN